jgi:hypothetical protein
MSRCFPAFFRNFSEIFPKFFRRFSEIFPKFFRNEYWHYMVKHARKADYIIKEEKPEDRKKKPGSG